MTHSWAAIRSLSYFAEISLITAVVTITPVWLWLAPQGAVIIEHAQDAQDFLNTLWQVEATAVALSAAVVTVGFQIYAGSRYSDFGGTLRQFAGSTLLPGAVSLGVVAVAFTGGVLLVISDGHEDIVALTRPEGLAVDLAIVLAALSLLSIPWVLIRSLRVGDVDFLQGQRLQRIKRDLSLAASWTARVHRGQKILRETMDKHRLVYSTLVHTPSTALVRAEKEGWIRDVRLDRLAYLGSAWGRGGRGEVEVGIFTGIGGSVREHSEVLGVPDSHPIGLQDAWRIFVVGSDPTPAGPVEDLRRTHRQGMTAIRDDDASAYAAVTDTYRTAVLWERAAFRQEGILNDDLDVPQSGLDVIQDDLSAQVGEAIKRERPEFVAAASNWPGTVAYESMASDKDYLLALRMIHLLSSLSDVVLSESTEGADLANLNLVAESIFVIASEAAEAL